MSVNGSDETYLRDQLDRIENSTSETHTLVSGKLDAVVLGLDRVSLSLKVISDQQTNVVRWLLWVVCIIALGTKLLELAKGFAPHP